MSGFGAAAGLEIAVLQDLRAVSEAAAERLALGCRAAVEERGECGLALSGGHTPKTLYELLAAEPYRSRIPWARVRVFWGDERCVPPDDPESNFRMAREVLLSHVPIPPDRVHRMPADRADLDAAAEEYGRVLRRRLPEGPGGWPRLDWVLLGLGDNAHTASLFPGGGAVREQRLAVAAEYVPQVGANRMTLTPPVLNAAAETVFLVAGASKADALWRVLEGPADPDAVPAQTIHPVAGRLAWLVDAAAAARLTRYPAPAERRQP